ncbi:MAG: hypothetical protein RLZZ373_2640 [Pseudomonadota bacterium]|jgi:hypothetical protein
MATAPQSSPLIVQWHDGGPLWAGDTTETLLADTRRIEQQRAASNGTGSYCWSRERDRQLAQLGAEDLADEVAEVGAELLRLLRDPANDGDVGRILRFIVAGKAARLADIATGQSKAHHLWAPQAMALAMVGRQA